MRDYFLPLLILVITAAFLLPGMSPRSGVVDRYAPPDTILQVRGRRIIGNDGAPVWLTGMNLGQWLVLEGYLWGLGPHRQQTYEYNYAEYELRERLDRILESTDISTEQFLRGYRDTFVTREDIAYLKSLGFNLLRIPFHTKDFDAYFNRGEIRDEDFLYLDRAVQWCREFELYCLLDLHAAPKAQSRLTHSDSTGRADFWQDADVQQKTISFWAVLATRYYNEPWIAGFDLLNESQAPNDRVLSQWYAQAIEAIRDTGNEHAIFIQPNNISLNIASILQKDSGVIYAPHYYGYGRRAEDENRALFAMKDTLDVPIMIGEVGNWANDWWAKYSSHFILYRYLRQQIPITYWTYKDMISDNRSSFGIVHGTTDGVFSQFARALESHSVLPESFDTDALLSSFATVQSPDRSDVVSLLKRSLPSSTIDALTSKEEADRLLQEDPPSDNTDAERYCSYIYEQWKPYVRCDGKTVGECFGLVY